MLQDVSKIKITGHVLITDRDTKEVILDKYNAINPETMSIAIAQSLCSLTTQGPIWQMVFGNGGVVASNNGQLNYLPPNVTGIGATLYNQTFEKIVNNQDPNNPNPSENFLTVSHVNGNVFSDVLITCTLDVGEPAGQNAFDTATSINSTYVFSELGITDYSGLLLTHVIFSPVEKSSNRSFLVQYTVRYQLV